MNISTIREFLVLSQTLNYSAAARQLYISQPVLSRHIMALEEELGTRLFTRDRRNVALTETGRIFSKSAQEIIAAYEKGRRGIRSVEEQYESSIRIDYISPTTGDYMPKACSIFHERHPSTHIALMSHNVEDIIENVRAESCDLGYVVAPDGLVGGLETATIFRDRYGVLCLKTNSFARRNSLMLDDLAGTLLLMPDPLVMPSLSTVSINAFEKCSVKPRFIEEMFDPSNISPFLRITNGLAFTLGHVIEYLDDKDDFVFIPVEDVAVRPHLTACWKKSRENALILDFVEAIRTAFEERG